MVDTTEVITETEPAEVIDPPAIDSKYRRIILAAQRSKQIQRGAVPRVEQDVGRTKPTRIAMEELKQRKVNFKFTNQESEIDETE